MVNLCTSPNKLHPDPTIILSCRPAFNKTLLPFSKMHKGLVKWLNESALTRGMVINLFQEQRWTPYSFMSHNKMISFWGFTFGCFHGGVSKRRWGKPSNLCNHPWDPLSPYPFSPPTNTPSSTAQSSTAF